MEGLRRRMIGADGYIESTQDLPFDKPTTSLGGACCTFEVEPGAGRKLDVFMELMSPFCGVAYKVAFTFLISLKVAHSAPDTVDDSYDLIKFIARVWTGLFPLIALGLFAIHGREYAGRKRAYYYYMANNVFLEFDDPKGWLGLVLSPLMWYMVSSMLLLIWQIAVFHCPSNYSIGEIASDLGAWGVCDWNGAVTDATAVATLVWLLVNDIKTQRSFAQDSLVNFHTFVAELGSAEVARRTSNMVVVKERRSDSGPSVANHWQRAIKVAALLDDLDAKFTKSSSETYLNEYRRQVDEAEAKGKFIDLAVAPTCTSQDLETEMAENKYDCVKRALWFLGFSGTWTCPAKRCMFGQAAGTDLNSDAMARFKVMKFMDHVLLLQLVGVFVIQVIVMFIVLPMEGADASNSTAS